MKASSSTDAKENDRDPGRDDLLEIDIIEVPISNWSDEEDGSEEDEDGEEEEGYEGIYTEKEGDDEWEENDDYGDE